MDGVILFEEYRLIERNDSEVNEAWKGAHLLLFFLAFVFGFFCTFCFHMLMYMFNEKCVLFPKLLSLTSLRHSIIFEFMPEDKEKADMLPVDFVSTQWVDKSVCYLPTYVPLVSGIFGLVWTTMFLMCSSGTQTLTGLQRPWRVLPPVLIFSVVMGGLCLYSSIVTHNGLQELCLKLGEITGSSTCAYTVNVATLVYERRIRGVYQATRLTILSAWLHTACWLLSALLTLARVILAVDFQLVRIRVELKGNMERMLERHEKHVRTVFPDSLIKDERKSLFSNDSYSSTKIRYKNKAFNTFPFKQSTKRKSQELRRSHSDTLYFSELAVETSEPSLVPAEQNKLARITAYKSVHRNKQFIVKMLYDLLDSINLPEKTLESPILSLSSSTSSDVHSETLAIMRQYGQEQISSKSTPLHAVHPLNDDLAAGESEAEQIAFEIKRNLQDKLNKRLIELTKIIALKPSSLKQEIYSPSVESIMNITSTLKQILEERLKTELADREEPQASTSKDAEKSKPIKKSNLKQIAVQTDKREKKRKSGSLKVHISESKKSVFTVDSLESSYETIVEKVDKETQTPKKEKQD